jgi:lipopolysaccharide cholinephosphotransferase
VNGKHNLNDCIQERNDYILTDEDNEEKLTVRDLQLSILPIMDEIHRICTKNNIKYGLIAGSALGIVNYKGFIPWDDDMDICILRSDWDKFIKALEKDLSDDFYFQCFENDKNYNTISGPNMKIRKKGTCIEEVNFLLKNRCKSGDGIFVDVVIYDNICENKFIDEVNRGVIKVIMPFIVLLDNIHINPVLLKKFVVWYSRHYSKKYKDSKLISQPISVPWEKFLHEPVFLKEDVLPFKLYEFEGRKFYSYNNIEKVLKEWYGPNCLKKWDGEKWCETLPEAKRKPKHTMKITLNHDKLENSNNDDIRRYLLLFAIISLIISLVLFNEASFVFLGIGIIIIGIFILMAINRK